MTLKTFHFAGVASMNVTLGVPRIKEIFNAIEDIKTPIISIELTNKKELKDALDIKQKIQIVWMSDILENIEQIYSPNQNFIRLILDQ